MVSNDFTIHEIYTLKLFLIRRHSIEETEETNLGYPDHYNQIDATNLAAKEAHTRESGGMPQTIFWNFISFCILHHLGKLFGSFQLLSPPEMHSQQF